MASLSSAMSVPDCCLTSPEHGTPTCRHRREFDRDMCVARTRWLLQQEAVLIVAALRADGVKVTPEVLRDALLIEVANSRPRLVAWNLSDQVVEKIAARAAADVAVGRIY